VVGFVEIGVPTYPEEVATEDTGELHFLFVAPDLMGGGIGSRLLARATELLHEDGYRQAILWVFRAYPNNPAARKAIKPQAKWRNAR
jgi:GNAT superfamily N-acetyltransferase